VDASDTRAGTVTRILRSLNAQGAGATDLLFDVVYAELRDLAAGYLRREANASTLQPTALVNEAYLKLVVDDKTWESRAHFVGVAARAMRQVLVDAARARNAQKRGGGARKLPLDRQYIAGSQVSLSEALALDEALEKLAHNHPRPARVAELRFFGELTISEAAHVLGVSDGTISSDWAFAKAWLARELSGDRDRA
jgi:RNA polymerase sigma factor (TIGR02999 family)